MSNYNLTLCSDTLFSDVFLVNAYYECRSFQTVRLLDVLAHPPESDKYSDLKRRLLSIFDRTELDRTHALLNITGLGNRQPSQLMDEMLSLLSDHSRCFLFKHLFFQQLPQSVRAFLVDDDFSDPQRAARQANRFLAAIDSQASVFAVSKPCAPFSRPVAPSSPTAAAPVCYYHRRFGAAARQCRPPCSFSGNGPAGRQ